MYKPVTVQTLDENEQWTDTFHAHAKINGLGGAEYWAARAYQAQDSMKFEFRYSKALAALIPQEVRILYNGRTYQVEQIDDFMQRHRTLVFKGVALL